MTLDIARLIEMRDAAEAAAMAAENDAFGPERAFSLAMVKAVRHPSKGGGLLERHAMLEAFYEAQQRFWTVEGSMRECNAWECLNDSLCEAHQEPYLQASSERNSALAALRASEALPGKGET